MAHGNGSHDPRPGIRAELEAVRTEFMELLARIPDELMDRVVDPPRWTYKQLMSHIESYLSFVLPKTLEAARKGKRKAFPIPPKPIADFMNLQAGKLGARKHTRESLVRKYEASHAATLRRLDEIRDGEWEKRTLYPAGDLTIAEQFSVHRNHFDHHAAQIRAGLARLAQTV